MPRKNISWRKYIKQEKAADRAAEKRWGVPTHFGERAVEQRRLGRVGSKIKKTGRKRRGSDPYADTRSLLGIDNPPRSVKGRKVKGGRAVTVRNFTGTVVKKSDGTVEILGRGRR